jgi:ribosomal biogenesis protein LAS1
MQLDAPESPASCDMQETHSIAVNQSSDTQISNSDMKTIIMKLSEKEPRLLLSVLKSVIEMIDANEELANKGTLKYHFPIFYAFCRNYSGIFKV